MSDTSVSLDTLHTMFPFPPKSVCSLHMRNVKLLDTIDSGWPILILARVFPYTPPHATPILPCFSRTPTAIDFSVVPPQ